SSTGSTRTTVAISSSAFESARSRPCAWFRGGASLRGSKRRAAAVRSKSSSLPGSDSGHAPHPKLSVLAAAKGGAAAVSVGLSLEHVDEAAERLPVVQREADDAERNSRERSDL